MDLTTHLSLPVIAAPMFLISGPDLVVECCKNGVIGTFPALNQRTTEGFEQWVVQIKESLAEYEKTSGKKAAPFGVNMIVHHSNPRVQADLAVCAKHKVPLIITSLGAVSQLVDFVHSYGGKVFHDVVKKRHAEKAAEAGVDGIICVSAGAGGHAGTINPMPLLHEVRSVFGGTLVLSGAISTGQDIASALQMGADLAYMGTRFINTKESMAPDDYREMISRSGANDVVYTPVVSGVPANFLRESLESMGLTEDMWKGEGKMDFGSKGDKVSEEAKAWKTIWSAGQGIAKITDSPTTAELIARLKTEFRSAIQKQAKWLDTYPKD